MEVKMKNIVENNYGEVTVVRNSDYEWGVVDNEENIIVPFGKYGWIDGFDNGLARVRTNKKLGLSNNPPVCIITPNNKLILGTENIKAYIEKDKKEHPDNYAKWGIINEKGEEVLPCEYDEIWRFYGKNRYSTRVVKDGIAREVYFHDLNPSLPKRGIKCHCYSDKYLGEKKTYDDYNGTYVQDVMGWSDQDIDDALDGEPDAYWNID
jgi:hypothetical protein